MLPPDDLSAHDRPRRGDWLLIGLALGAAAAKLVLVALFLLPVGAVAAPKRDRPAPKADEIVGESRLGLKDGPTVVIPREGEADLEVWLVFAANPEAEALSRTLKEGDRVRARGRLAHGGEWTYLIVAGLSKDE